MLREIDLNSLEHMQLAYTVLRELRTSLSFEDFLQLSRQAHGRDEYKIVCLEKDGRFEGYIGYRILYDFVHGKHLYVDDLVISERVRSQGLGAELLKYAEDEAKKNGCTKLRLCTGVENDRGKTFYDRNGWTLRAVVYKKSV